MPVSRFCCALDINVFLLCGEKLILERDLYTDLAILFDLQSVMTRFLLGVVCVLILATFQGKLAS